MPTPALDLDTLTLLFAMMIININLRRAGFFQIVAKPRHPPRARRTSCWRISSCVGRASAIFLNDNYRARLHAAGAGHLPGAQPTADPLSIALVTARPTSVGGDDHRQPAEHAHRRLVGDPLQHLHHLAPVALAGMVSSWVVWRWFFVGLWARLVKEPVVGLHTETRLLRKACSPRG